jgi:Ca-activated chloride channel family protein
LNIQTDRALIPAGSTAERFLAITITAPTREAKTERPAVNVALVLDRSGSMAGRKIEMARKAVEHAVRLLNERDRLALVCYDTEINTLLSATPATPEAKTLALARLRAIDARGSTDLCGGWTRAADEIAGSSGSAGSSAAITRVLLLSDGLANHGETDPTVLAERAAALHAKGITTSTFGLGADFDEQLMSRLATQGGGHFYFIEQPAQIPDYLTSELGEALEVTARDVRLIIAGPAGVAVGCLNDFPAQTMADGSGGQEVHVRLGDLVSAQQITIVIAVQCPAVPAGAEVSVSARLADRDQALFAQPMTIDWTAVDADANAAQPVNTDVLVQAGRLIAERSRAAALDANRRGDFQEAARILNAAAASLRALDPGIRELEALAAELEAEEPDYVMHMEPLALKARHFASYNQSVSRSATGKARR